jgi:hypothetical protein
MACSVDQERFTNHYDGTAVRHRARPADVGKGREADMQIIWDILLQTVEIITLLCGILGLAFSLMLAFSPGIIETVGKLMNRHINFEKNLAVLDKDITTGHLFYNHPRISGSCLIAGSAFALLFFFFKLDVSNFSAIFLGSASKSSIGEVLFHALAWLGKIACALGLLYGIGLLVIPESMKSIEKKMNAWVETRPVLEKLNSQNHNLDSIIYRFPITFGLAGATISFLLIILSVLNILD